jgi:hypothetical protein
MAAVSSVSSKEFDERLIGNWSNDSVNVSITGYFITIKTNTEKCILKKMYDYEYKYFFETFFGTAVNKVEVCYEFFDSEHLILTLIVRDYNYTNCLHVEKRYCLTKH